MKNIILHLSHTDIRFDSRILKELKALESFQGYHKVAIGVFKDEGASASNQVCNAQVVTLKLFTKVFKVFPRIIRYALNFIELTFLMFYRGMTLKPKIVHCHDTLVLPVGWLIKVFTGCRLIYDAHELESDKNGQNYFLSKSTLVVEKILWKRIDLLITVGDAIGEWYFKHIGQKEQIVILNSPEINTSRNEIFDREKSSKYFHTLYNLPENKIIFVYLGIVGVGRGIETCLKCFSDSNIDAHVVFVGYGELSNLITTYSKKHSNIHLHPPVPHEQVVSLVTSADVGLCFVENVSLSDYYCLPNKLFEYCFAGLPILASNFPEIKRIVEQYSLGVCCSPDIISVREAIMNIVKDPPSKIVSDLSELSWVAQSVRLCNAYEKILSAGRASA